MNFLLSQIDVEQKVIFVNFQPGRKFQLFLFKLSLLCAKPVIMEGLSLVGYSAETKKPTWGVDLCAFLFYILYKNLLSFCQSCLCVFNLDVYTHHSHQYLPYKI